MKFWKKKNEDQWRPFITYAFGSGQSAHVCVFLLDSSYLVKNSKKVNNDNNDHVQCSSKENLI